MYLLVFVTLVIGLISIYGQILTVQAERIAASMTGLASAMTMWHAAAVSMAGSITKTGAVYVSPCSLTFTLPPGVAARCPVPIGWAPPTGWSAAAIGTITDGSAIPVLNNIIDVKHGSVLAPVDLPRDFAANRYQFYSVLYTGPQNQPYVLTYIRPPAITAANPPPGLIQLPPTNALTRYTITDIISQLKQSNLTSVAWGTVSNNQLSAGGFSYTLPAGICPNNTVAIVSSPVGF